MKQQLKRISQSIVFELCRSAIWSADRCTWLGPKMEFNPHGNKTYYQKPLNHYFYDGMAGIVFFLASYLKIEEEPIVKKTLTGAVNQLIALQQKVEQPNLSFHTGIIGTAYALFQAGAVTSNKAWIKAAEKHLKQAKTIQPEHWRIDVIDGNAGAIPVLLFLHQHFPKLHLVQLAIELGNDLLSKAQSSAKGYSWDTFNGTHLLGFGHGTAGIANALFHLYKATNDHRFSDAAIKALEYENAFFNREKNNWPDIRKFGEDQNAEPNYPYLWCHGAAGIGLSRITAFYYKEQSHYFEEIEIAANTVSENLNFLSLPNFSLCHGLFGNADFLLEANRVLNQDSIKEQIDQLVQFAAEQFFNKGRCFPADAPGKNLSPCFMLGKAGIGYFLLRYIYPEQFPSILGLCFKEPHFAGKQKLELV